MKVDETVIERVAASLASELARRNEWYGLDNWSPREVVEFVLECTAQAVKEGVA